MTRHGSPPDGLEARTARIDDAEAIAGVINAVSLREVGVRWEDPARIRDDLRRVPREGFDDQVLVDRSGAVVGYLGFYVEADPFEVDVLVCVDPSLDGTGANAWLLREAEARAIERKPGAEAIVSAGRFLGVEAGKRLFEALGFAYARTFWMLGIDLVDPPAPATPPGRIEIRTFDRARDEEAVHRTFVEAFADHWGAAFPPIETWRSGALDGEGSGFDPGLWFVALDEEEVVGAIATRPSSPRNENAAYVEDLGVRRAWRRRGIARALLLSVFAEAFRRGIARVELSVDSESETGANRLYERVGMTGAYGWEEWRKIV